jgi:hypothetical protein
MAAAAVDVVVLHAETGLDSLRMKCSVGDFARTSLLVGI